MKRGPAPGAPAAANPPLTLSPPPPAPAPPPPGGRARRAAGRVKMVSGQFAISGAQARQCRLTACHAATGNKLLPRYRER